MTELILFVLMGMCTVWIITGFFSVLSTTRRKAHPDTEQPGISVLKPLCGADAGLAANLESFFLQSHPDFELLFGVQDPRDPAVPIVKRLMARYPNVPARLVVHPGGRGINPKVKNLEGLLPHARHDLVLISDSNVRAPERYLTEAAATLGAGEGVGLVTNLFAGSHETRLGAALENVQLNGFCAAGAALPTLAGDPLVIGKSMLFSQRAFEAIGGFERVANVLAEDFVIGKMFQHAGYGIRIAPTVLSNVTGKMGIGDFLRRHLRWSALRWRLRPAAFLVEPLSSPLVLLPAAWLLVGPWALVWALFLMWLRDVGGWILLRGIRRAWLPALLAPVRDACIFAVWLCAPFAKTITWRGHRVRLGAGTLLFQQGR